MDVVHRSISVRVLYMKTFGLVFFIIEKSVIYIIIPVVINDA